MPVSWRIWLLAVALVSFEHTAADRYDMRLNELICQFNSNIIFNMTCNHIHQKSGIQTISIDVHTRTVIHSLGVKISLFHKKHKEKKYRIFLGLNNVTVDMCGYLRGAQQSGLMDIIVKDIKKYGNIFHACPFSGHLYVKDYVADDAALPRLLPLGEYILQTSLFTKQNGTDVMVTSARFIGSLKPAAFKI